MEVILKELEDSDIIIERSITFNKLNEKEYINLFEEKIYKGIINESTGFFDDSWIVKIGGVDRVLIFPNELQFKKISKIFGLNMNDFELAYRSFIVMKLDTYFSVYEFNQYFKQVAEESIKIKSSNNVVLESFFDFLKISETTFEYFKENLDGIESYEPKPRRLPEFEDILKFNDIVNDIIENKNIIDYKMYILTIMWWKICSILPLRPSEFLRTEFKCIYIKENEFYLKVKRTKAKTRYKRDIKNVSKVEDYYLDDVVNIDEGLFYLIKKYQDILVNEFNYKEKKELFPVVVLKETRLKDRGHRKTNFNIITTSELQNNIENFYIEVIKKEYGLNPINGYIERDENSIEKLVPYNARHIAIINLILLGTDVLEVMYLAGHTKVNTAYNYFNHVKEFSRGYALGYAKKLKSKFSIEKDLMIKSGFSKGSQDFERVLGKIQNKKANPKKVKGGYCFYNNIDNDKSLCFKYERNHFVCEYFTEDEKEFLKNEINKVEKSLDSDIKVLNDLIQDMKYVGKFNELYQTTSYRISKSIKELSVLNQKFMMED
ncbi:site-specific integrase [Clostridium perfringens]|uniref:site-specific integrase n=1 Tax=Clostridium perfringens TaxID=1502 RepID=UPI002906F546|nr:site-specific integrase [Clostridium perfringens]EJT6170774.1 site-specific integrase [Clostridium perfringens]EJT6541499.1 site-specific integrase [Clostridium perfringens]EJT6566506.1 site-specific integrase [Clostridium perfringens]MBS5994759.1 site-specific integrase [Clostridium perfringens]MDM0997114.1 site-specific integrase [Clostridium perfringens]